jgi:hypothetical protein
MPEMINDAVTKTVVALLPHLLTAYMEWVDGGKIGPSPLTSFTESSLIRPFCITILYPNLLLFIDIFHI